MTDVFGRLAGAGVDFVIDAGMNYRLQLDAAELGRLLELGRDHFLRDYFKVSSEVWEAFEAHVAEPRCSAQTRSGNPCRGHVERFYGAPSDFIVGAHDRCPVHREVQR